MILPVALQTTYATWHQSEFICCHNMMLTSLVTDKRMDGRVEKRMTNGPLRASLAGKRHKNGTSYISLLLRDAMHKRGQCRYAVSVRVYVTFMSCVKMNKHIIKLFSRLGSHTILVFPCQTA